MDLEKLTGKISELYQSPGLTLKQAHERIARHVALMVLEAELKGIHLGWTDNDKETYTRYREIMKKIIELKKG